MVAGRRPEFWRKSNVISYWKTSLRSILRSQAESGFRQHVFCIVSRRAAIFFLGGGGVVIVTNYLGVGEWGQTSAY